nr:hypothetical protein [Tanacetum cinerariifolium]
YVEVKESKDICKKFYQGPSGGVVIRETPEMHVSKKKEKMNVLRENEEGIGDDDEKEEDKFIRTPFNNFDDDTKVSNKAEGDEDEEIDYTTSQLSDDMDIQLNELDNADEG